MKFSYTLIKKLAPGLPKCAKVAEALNMYSFETKNLGGDLLEINLPANRWSDASSHLGIAREAAAIFKKELRSPVVSIINAPMDEGLVKVEVEKQKYCPRYAARFFEIKRVSQSPEWLRKILRACGINPVNNVVDVMNYVMLEVGQPLHAFDADKIYGKKTKKIVVRRAKKNERLKTLDGQSFVLNPDILVIADPKQALAIAGIKGGESSGVTGRTRRLIIEAANFDPVMIYKASRRLKLITDAAARFSHGMSPALVEWGLDRATALLKKSGAKLLDSVDFYTEKAGEEVIEFDPAKFRSVIGAPIAVGEARKIFKRLGLLVDKSEKAKLRVRIPAWRTDIEEPEDLIEEAARFLDFNALRPQAPVVGVKPTEEEDVIVLKEKVRRLLQSFQLDEVYSPSFLGETELGWCNQSFLGGMKVNPVEVENPIAEDKKYVRPSLLPLLIRGVELNSRFFDSVKIFEIGKVFSVVRGAIKERLALGIVLGAKKDTKLVLELKGLTEELLRGLGIDDYDFVETKGSMRVEVNHDILGVVGQEHLGKNWLVTAAEFDLERILKQTEEEKEYIPLKRFPAVIRDISILVSKNIRIGEILETIQRVSPKLTENVDLIDEYVNEKLGGKQSLTFRVIFQSDERTLTDAEVNKEMAKISGALKRSFRAEIR